MTDNVTTSAPVGEGPRVATDDISGTHYQRVKMTIGADGVNDGDVCTTNPLPVVLSATSETPITFADSAQLGSFGWLRTADPNYVFDAQLTYDLAPLLFEKVTNGTGATVTHNAPNRYADIAFANTTTGGKAYLQQYEHNRYQPGRSQAVLITGNFVEHKPNVLKFLKYGEGVGGNGVALESNGTGFQVTLYSTTTVGDRTILQADWNVDKLDGTGASGYTLDVTKGVIFFIDAQALYYGRVRCGVDIDGQVIIFHVFNNANNLAPTYVATFNCPISAGMTCTGTVSTTMQYTCCSVISEGGQEDIHGYNFNVEGTATAGNETRAHLLSVRPKALFNSIVNRTKFVLSGVQLIVTGNASVKWELVLGQAISGTTTFLDANASYSAFEYNTLGTISGSPAIVIDSGWVNSSSTAKGSVSTQVPMKYPITLDAAGAVRPLGTLSLLVSGIGATSACRGALDWKEIR